MPWCEDCAKYWAPSAMTPEGACPRCGRELDAPEPRDRSEPVADDERAPWHFKLMVVALVVYLVYRFYAIFT
jgi:hypothetical protein